MKRREFLKNVSLGTAFISLTGFYSMKTFAGKSPVKDGKLYVKRPECELPIIDEADVLVIGGSTAGVAAAEAASENGAKVFLVCGDPYLGEDINATYRFWDIQPSGKTKIESRLYHNGLNTPNEIKKGLENILLEQDIPFVFSSYVSNILKDVSGNPAGVVFANRSGEQVVKAAMVIDATERGTVARILGAPFTDFPSGEQVFDFTVLGNSPKSGYPSERLNPPVKHNDKAYHALRYRLKLSMEDSSFASFARAEQKARDITWDAGQVDASDRLFQIPPDHVRGIHRNSEEKVDFARINLDCFRPKGHPSVYVLGGCADISRKAAEKLMDPSNMLLVGRRIGKQAAGEAQQITRGRINPRQKQYPSAAAIITQHQDEMRPQHQFDSLRIKDEHVPVIGRYDVVVMGGGASGAPAAISASREGVKTLMIEYLHGLGGTETMGLIGRYYHGYRKGFTEEVDREVNIMGGENHPRRKERKDEWVRDWKMEWFRKEIRKAGGDIWFGAMGCGTVVEDNVVKGVVVATPHGKGVVLADKVIDSTGSGDLAIAAGAGYDYTGADTVAIQGAGLPHFNPDDYYNNTDWTFINDSDVFDVTRTFLTGRRKFSGAFDTGKLPQTRERRRIVGDYRISVLDVYNNRTYPDTLSYHKSSFDTHGFTIDPFFTLRPPEGSGIDVFAEMPLRAMLPKGLENILVTGLGTSAHRDAMPVIRMQPCLQNQGYSVGLLSAQTIRSGKKYREANLKPLQKRLVELGNLPENVLEAKDNYPPSEEKVRKAIDRLPDDFKGLEMVVWNLEESIPLLKEKLKQTGNPKARITYAYVLGIYGYADGWKVLRDAVDQYNDWDKGWHYTGMGQFGASSSRLDGLIMALGRCRKEEALPTIHRMAGKLNMLSAFSHFRAIVEACEAIGSRNSVPVLTELIHMPGIRGYAVTTYEGAIFASRPVRKIVSHYGETEIRNRTLKELFLARGLYRCGDPNGLGKKILKEYANDLRGHYARHARGVLEVV
jgi:flavin-dependent dehydrogenase